MESTQLTSQMACASGPRALEKPELAADRRGRPSLKTLVLWAALATMLCLICTSPRADTFDIVSKQLDTPSTTVWRIENPNVKLQLQEYPEIAFAPDDRVMVTAGGCVQTGGHGKTWKRYVDPSGPNSDHLYHGLILVPGVNASPVRLQQFGLNVEHLIASIPIGPNGADAHLQLGYEDDEYDDNGYWGHDDGTEDQCAGSVNAFVIISVGHSGTQPLPAPSFIGISPDNFRCQAAWAFHNFDTARLSLDSFTNAFDFQWYDYLDPVVGIAFLAARDSLASGGNCMGMAFLADATENQFIVGDLTENLWDNYKSRDITTPRVTEDINTAHWAQLSAAFMNYYLNNVIRSPADNARLVESDLTRGVNANYGMISIAHGTDGHVVVPLRVSHSGSTIMIDVYDPNRQCGAKPDTATYPPIIINGDTWSFVMGSGETWSGSTANDGLAYVPYTSASGWRRFGADFAGAVQIIFGSNAKVEQVTDTKGRTLFLPGSQKIDTSASGLGKAVLHLPVYSQSRPRNGDPLYKVTNPAKPPLSADTVARFEKEYAADYRDLRSSFIVKSADLSRLTFQVSSVNTSRPVRSLIYQRGQFFEIKATSASRLAITIANPSSLASGGIYFDNEATGPISAVFTSGQLTDGTVHVQTTTPIAVTSARVGVRESPTGIRLTSPVALRAIAIKDELTTANGRKASTMSNVRILPE
ncbi:hypothetical protein [Variovorax sp. dw_308]|uniref:hypothetical protein n=1 Tax=Variovorax sp. dw_308 TaxID=2721546 RepID=UPI001C49520F|nr:hypothetical protein [Variovorax sp. dw_308]